MGDVASNPEAMKLLREQRIRLADRLRPPWWYLTGGGFLFALTFAFPFGQRYLPQGFPNWPILLPAVLLAVLLQWGLSRATGISVGFPDLTYRPGRPARIAMLAVTFAATAAEHYLIDRGLVAVAIVVAVLAVAAGMACLQAAMRMIRHSLAAGEGAA